MPFAKQWTGAGRSHILQTQSCKQAPANRVQVRALDPEGCRDRESPWSGGIPPMAKLCAGHQVGIDEGWHKQPYWLALSLQVSPVGGSELDHARLRVTHAAFITSFSHSFPSPSFP